MPTRAYADSRRTTGRTNRTVKFAVAQASDIRDVQPLAPARKLCAAPSSRHCAVVHAFCRWQPPHFARLGWSRKFAAAGWRIYAIKPQSTCRSLLCSLCSVSALWRASPLATPSPKPRALANKCLTHHHLCPRHARSSARRASAACRVRPCVRVVPAQRRARRGAPSVSARR